jgi:hypothetical protein
VIIRNRPVLASEGGVVDAALMKSEAMYFLACLGVIFVSFSWAWCAPRSTASEPPSS